MAKGCMGQVYAALTLGSAAQWTAKQPAVPDPAAGGSPALGGGVWLMRHGCAAACVPSNFKWRCEELRAMAPRVECRYQG